ncbi:competence protein CoiA family protein [Actinoplanes xinjiangensis]|uniref:competence protein CoiA family protein n=1 Tax=Actinoplanes xinjiangensis TaxID=512350 RepID=UPI003434F3E7
MTFAAIHPEAGRIDATLDDLGCGLSWSAIYKVRPRIALTCPDCEHGVHAKVSARKLKHFAHDPGRPADCAWLNESLEHHLLKLELATRIRDAGWHAELEVRADDGTWRADVLASAHDDSRRIASEAQLSPITDDDIRDRTERYRNEDIDVCWVSPAETTVRWLSKVPSIRVRDPKDGRSWEVVDGVARFDFQQGAWIAVDDLDLTQFILWVLNDKTTPHQVLPRYRRVWFPTDQRYGRRQLIWTSQRSVGEEARHEVKRQRQEEWRRQQEEKERLAEQQRQEEEARLREAQRLEEERQRKIRAEADRIRREEQLRQWAIEDEQRRIKREAEERQRKEAAAAAEQERLRQEQLEFQAAKRWWKELSPTQIQELHDAVAGPLWKKEATRVAFKRDEAAAATAYGIPAYVRHRLYGILRPSPASLHRLPPAVPVFVRNGREAQLIADTGKVDATRIVHFNLPDHEQMPLI